MEKSSYDKVWHWFLTGEKNGKFPLSVELWLKFSHTFYKWFPGDPRCFECEMPLAGLSSVLLRPMGSRPSSFSSRLCSACENFVRQHEGGAEVEMTLLFADVRDSTPLAEAKGTLGFKDIINRFYKEASDVLVAHHAMVNRLMGDQIIALFVPRFAGEAHAKVALHATQELLRVTGHRNADGPWVPVGAGIHTGLAYVGAVGSAKGVNEIAVLGSAANMCARLSSKAATGEILISEDSVKSGNLDVKDLESRSLELKGVSQPVSVRAIKV
ncbi:MAG TPA: adenylate/guanylate cyclase domain-containing protein [Anaerolineales bacterium]|nr:adenylate/guanylate cyclase domain-containing protein [Anaerolineales bacterium]